MDSLRKSFKSHGSYKHMRRLSSLGGTSKDPRTSHEALPMLSDSRHNEYGDIRVRTDIRYSDRPEVVLNMSPAYNNGSDGGGNAGVVNNGGYNGGGDGKVIRESSIEFWKDSESNARGGNGESRECADDPPSQLIGQFLRKQSASSDVSLDMDLEMDELRCTENSRRLPPVAESTGNTDNRARDIRVSFDQGSIRSNSGSPVTDGSSGSEDGDHENLDEEVLKCTSNASFLRKSTLLRAKTRSRLMDPPNEPNGWSGMVPKSGMIPRSGPVKSGMLSKVGDDDDDDNSFDEDLPDDLKMSNLSALTVLQWVSLILIVAVLIGTLAIPSFKKKCLWRLRLWKWEVMILVLICGRLLSGWGIRIGVFLIERNFVLRKKVLYFVYGVRRAVQNSLWLGLVLIAWNSLFDKSVEAHTNAQGLKYVTKVLVCLLVATLLWLGKTLIIKVLASSFHVSTYFDRIQESLFNQYVIEILSGPPLVELRSIEEEEARIAADLQTLQNAGAMVTPELRAAAFSSAKSRRVIGSSGGGAGLQRSPLVVKSVRLSRALSKKGDEGITIDNLHKLNPKNVSAWKMKRLIKMVRKGVLSTLDEQAVNSTYEDESTNLIRSEHEAKVAAKKIFRNVAKQGSKYIYLEDLMCFMKEDEALKTMMQIEGAAERKKISKSNLKNWLVNLFRERRALALTLNDTKTAVNKLHHVANGIVGIIILVIWLLILGIATSKFLLFLSSQLVVVAFIFGNTCKTIFEAIIFLFVIHPFDVGDRCEVDGVQLIVEEMNILTTVFLRYDNQKVLYPNSTLSTKSIGNYYRSPDMGDSLEFLVHISTPAEKIAAIKQRITSYIEGKKEHWCSLPTVIMKDLEDLNRVRIAVWFCHKMNHQNMGEKWVRRALLLEELVKILRELDLQYRLLPLDINVKSLPPTTSTRIPPSWTGNQ